MSEVAKRSRLRREIPEKHCINNDARLMWLWNQRMAVVQSVFTHSQDVQSRMTAGLALTAGLTQDLGAIRLFLQRLEGGAISDQAMVEQDSMPL